MSNIARVFPVFGVVYVLSYALWFVAADQGLFSHNALFAYYPALGEAFWSPQVGRPIAQTGPAMLWYGWIANSTIVGAIAAGIALALHWGQKARLWATLIWVAPIISFAVLCYFERNWFLR
jgi:hypothetical protein